MRAGRGSLSERCESLLRNVQLSHRGQRYWANIELHGTVHQCGLIRLKDHESTIFALSKRCGSIFPRSIGYKHYRCDLAEQRGITVGNVAHFARTVWPATHLMLMDDGGAKAKYPLSAVQRF